MTTKLTDRDKQIIKTLAVMRKMLDELLGELVGDRPPRPTAKAKQSKAQVAALFDVFKEVYPRPTGMTRAKAVWLVLDPSPELVGQIVEKVKLFKRTTWAGREMDKIPHAATFLHQRRWEDDPETPSTGRRPVDLGRLPPAHDGPPADLFVRHVDRLKAALARGAVAAMLRAPVLAAVVKTVDDLPVDRPSREAAEAKLEKIEARLLEVVTAAVGEAGQRQAEQLAGEELGANNGRMAPEQWAAARGRAFENEVRKMAGLPAPW